MSVEEAVYSKLTGDAGVAALIGARIYPLYVPQNGALPAVVYERISTTRSYAHNGNQSHTVVRLQIDSIATTLSSAKAVAAAVLASLDAFTGAVGGLTIHAVFCDNEVNLFDPETNFIRVVQDYLISFMEV